MRELTTEDKRALIQKLVDELPVLRAKLGLSQEELGERIGLSRQMVVAMENKRRPMTWNTYLSLMMLFLHNRSTAGLIRALGVYTDDLRQFLDVSGPECRQNA
ncbi:MAG TPA: helix-turn-helix domain-containing protein [Firmicutes bacterium]|nr:helix-turn-helix domain-containing protein [Bacillota bacterium]